VRDSDTMMRSDLSPRCLYASGWPGLPQDQKNSGRQLFRVSTLQCGGFAGTYWVCYRNVSLRRRRRLPFSLPQQLHKSAGNHCGSHKFGKSDIVASCGAETNNVISKRHQAHILSEPTEAWPRVTALSNCPIPNSSHYSDTL